MASPETRDKKGEAKVLATISEATNALGSHEGAVPLASLMALRRAVDRAIESRALSLERRARDAEERESRREDLANKTSAERTAAASGGRLFDFDLSV